MFKFSRRANIIAGVVVGAAVLLYVLATGEAWFVVKRSSCPFLLTRIVDAQRAVHAEHKRYTAKMEELEEFRFDTQDRDGRPVYTFVLSTAHPSGLTDACADCEFVATCARNLPDRDVWSIASVERSILGQTVPAFTPFHDVVGDD